MRRVFIFLGLLVLAQQLKASDLEGIYFNASGITVTPGLDKGFRYRASFGYLVEEPRIGVGGAFEWIPRGNPSYQAYATSWYSTDISGKTNSDWNLFRIPLEFYYFPYVSAGYSKPLGGENARSAMYFYASISPWSTISDSAGDYSDWEDLNINGVSSNEFGVGYTIGGIFDVKLAYSNLYTSGLQNADFNFPEYSEKKWFIALDFYLGCWAFPSSIKTGWLPAIKEEIENARYARENARPKLHSISQEKAVTGSVISIFGENFRAEEKNTKVFVGNKAAEILGIRDDRLGIQNDRIEARIPGDVESGNADVSVRTSKGKSRSVNLFILPSKPPLLTVSDIVFEEETGDKILNAGEKSNIRLRVSNAKGAGKAFGLRINVDTLATASGSQLEFPWKIEIGDLAAGDYKEILVPIIAGLDTTDGEKTFSLKITEANDFGLDPFEVKIQTRKLEPPDLQLAKLEVDDRFEPDRPDKLAVGNGNSVVELGESVEVSATLLNKGTGLTKDTKVKVVSASPDITFLSPTEFASGDIQPGNWQDLKIAFSVKKGYKGQDDLPIKLVISDERERFNKELPLDIKLKRSYPKTELVDIKGKETQQKPVVMPSFGDELLKIPFAKAENRDAIAVVIGVQNYKNKDVPSVEYALNDAQLFKDYLQTALGYREGNIIYLENPTKANLEKVFGTSDNHAGQLSDYVKKDKSDVFVYYTGHGAPDLRTKQAYFVPSDADPNYVKLGGYPLNVFYDNLSRLPARHISVVLDTCFSGQSDKGMIISKASPLMIVPVLPGSGNIDVFSSSKADEVSSWYPEKRHSLFTYFFLKGLQGNADKNKDRSITAAELDEYVAENVPYYARRLYGRKQTPAFTGKEDRIVAKY